VFNKSLSNEGSTVKEVPCMGIVKKAIETNQKTQVVSWIALGVAVFALAVVLVGVKNAR
jgi:hypothetical protein